MTWGFVAVGSAILGSAIISSNAAEGAAATQANAAAAAGTTSLEGLKLQLAADKLNVDNQILAQKDNLTATLKAQSDAAAAGNVAAQNMLNQQLAAQKAALDESLKLQRELFNKQVENLKSFKDAGEKGQARLMDLMGLSDNKTAPGYGSATTAFKVEGFDPKTLFNEFVETEKTEADPGYAFRLAEGQKALERSTAASRGLQSGAALKAATRYGQEMGSQEYQNAFARSQASTAAAFNRFQANKAFQAQEYGNAFNRFTTERQNQIAPLQALTASGQASAAGQAAAAGNFASGGSQAIQNAGAGQAAAYGNYGAMTGDIAARTGAGTTAAYGNYGGNVSNIYNTSAGIRQSAYATNTANQVNAITGAGNAMAAGQIGSANAFSNALGQATSLYGMYNQNQLLSKYLTRT
jgi:hypothetical protein